MARNPGADLNFMLSISSNMENLCIEISQETEDDKIEFSLARVSLEF